MPLAPIPSELIKKTAGESRFEAGLQAARHAVVRQLEITEKGAQGFVDHHRVTVTLHGEQLSGACDCEDSDGFDFCHHCVVLSLFANRQTQTRRSLAKGPDRSKVLAYLLNLDKHVLAKQLLDILEDDADLFKRYVLKAALESSDIDYRDLRQQITAMTRAQDRLFSQRQVKHFFARIEQFLEALTDATPAEPERMLKLLDYLIQRLSLILDDTDDRSGQRLESARLLTALYQLLFARFEGRSSTRTKRYLETWHLDRHDLLLASPDTLLDAKGCTLFIDALNAAWPSAKSAAAQRIARTLYRMQAIDLSQKQGIAMRSSLAQEAQDWLDIADALIQHQQAAEAIAVLEQAQSRFPEHSGIAHLLARLYLGRNDADSKTKLAQLCDAHPNTVATLIFPTLTPAASVAQGQTLNATQASCYAQLQRSTHGAHRELCLQIALYCGEADNVQTWLAEMASPSPEYLLHGAQLVQATRPDAAIALLRRCFDLLLSKQRPSADRELAGLLQAFPIDVSPAQKQALIDEFRVRMLRRPAIVEALRRSDLALDG